MLRRGALVRVRGARGRPYSLDGLERASASGSGSRRRCRWRCSSCPGIALAWLWAAPVRSLWVRLRRLAWGGLAMTVVGLAWPLLVTLTPAADRPWISGTSDNSVWSLIVNYNGVGRVTGQAGAPSQPAAAAVVASRPGATGRVSTAGLGAGRPGRLADRFRGRGRRRAGRADAAAPWRRAHRLADRVGGAFAVSAVVFSVSSGIVHPYYVSFLAPWTAMLIGAGVGEALRRRVRARAFGALAIAGGAVTELVVLGQAGGSVVVGDAAGDRRLRAGGRWRCSSSPSRRGSGRSSCRRDGGAAGGAGGLGGRHARSRHQLDLPGRWAGLGRRLRRAGWLRGGRLWRRGGFGGGGGFGGCRLARRFGGGVSVGRRRSGAARERGASVGAAAAGGGSAVRRRRCGRAPAACASGGGVFGGDSVDAAGGLELRRVTRRRHGRRSRARAAPRRRSSPAKRTSPGSAASPARRARSARRGWRWRSATAGCGGRGRHRLRALAAGASRCGWCGWCGWAAAGVGWCGHRVAALVVRRRRAVRRRHELGFGLGHRRWIRDVSALGCQWRRVPSGGGAGFADGRTGSRRRSRSPRRSAAR